MTPQTSAPGDHTPVRDTADEPVSVPAQPEAQQPTYDWYVRASVPARSGGSGSGPQSGEQIRNLRDWIEENRDNLNLGSYRLVRLIGTGAFGMVWEAEHTVSGARVAIKFLAASDQSWEKKLEEVQRLEDLKRTPGIVSVFDVSRGSAGLPPYYVMTLASGALGDRLKQLKKAGSPAGAPLVPVAEAVRLFTAVVTALAAVHRRGIYHCDLKPPNVLLDGDGPDQLGTPLIADFGQAHLATDDTPALGTFFYMPPDQVDAALRKAPPDSSWDVYAVAAVLYEMLTGEPPRSSPTLLKELRNTEHLDTKLTLYRDRLAAEPPPTAHRALVDAPLARLIDRCLDPDPKKRPRDAGAIEDALRRRAWWRQTRRPLAVGTAAGIWLVLILMLASTLVAIAFHDRAKAAARKEAKASLARTAEYGARLVAREFRPRVAFVEQREQTCRVRSALLETAKRVGAAQHTNVTEALRLTAPHQKSIDDWVNSVFADAQQRWVAANSVSLVLVTADRTGAGNHGFTLSSARPGEPPPKARDDRPDNYRRDWAFRDYFNGTGNQFEDEQDVPGQLGKPFPVIRHTHISHAYQSRRGDKEWLVDITTPVWSNGDRSGEVVALLSLAVPLAELENMIVIDANAHAGDATSDKVVVSAYVVNDRKCWVWHEDGKHALDTDPHRDPHNLEQLAETIESDERVFVPWSQSLADPSETDPKYVSYDQVKHKERGKKQPDACIHHSALFNPYERSEYEALRSRQWVFVAQIDEEQVLAPIRELKLRLYWTGSVLVLTLVALVVVLWVWLLRVLRNWEFVTHG